MSNIIKGYKIDIPNATGNIVITAKASYKSDVTEPINGDIMNYLTYNKSINQTTGVIKDETGCWASVNSMKVERGATYTLKMDATWAWVYSFDDNGNFVSALALGNDKNPQELRFTADTTKIKIGCYDPNNQLSYCTITKVVAMNPEEKIYTITNDLINCTNNNPATSVYENSSYIATITEKDGYALGNVNVVMNGADITPDVVSDISDVVIPEPSEVYSISYNLSNCTSDNTSSTAIFGNSYSTTIIMNSGYELMNISITMGGVNVTNSVYTYQNGNAVINIPSVTGNVVIIAQATASNPGGSIPEVTNYTIIRRLTNCSSNNTSTSVTKGASYSAIITADSGYTLNNITVTMGGTDMTSTAVSGNTIDIISVTGDIVIIAQATESSSGSDSPSNTINCMSYSKGINFTTGEIIDNPSCWATVDPITVEKGTTYTLKMDATWGWVCSYDSNDNLVSILSQGSSANPQDITFTANTTKIRYGCYDPNHTLTYCNLTNNDEVKIALYKISNMIVYKGQRFNILYSSNISAVKHEISWDGGITFWDKTSEILVENTVNYKYAHNADTEYDLFNMAIRVTDKNENTDVTYFTITFKDNEVEDNFVFTRYKRLNDGVLVDYTDESEASYYSTVNMNEVTAGASYTIGINLCNYINVCYYDENGSYVTSSETHTDNWSVKGFSTTITIPSNVKYIRVCATNDGTQVIGTLTKKVSTQDLLDSTGAYVIDDFSGTSVDENKWGYELGYVRNGESQRYTNSNAEVNDGILALRGLKDSNGNWTSSSIISKHHFAFMYGKIVARIKPCNYNGAFGAFWTLGDSFEFAYNEWGGPSDLSEWWPWCGEFDIMEFYNHNLTCGTFFGNRQESGRVWYSNYDTGAWHEFGMEWLENGTLIFTIDGNELSRTSPTDDRAFHIPHFILLNQAVGASGGTPDASTTEITQYVDWVKYYPASTENLVLNSSNFELVPGDFQDNHCILRLKFNDNCINKSVDWSSSNSGIISVHNGLCAAVSTGNAVITATSQSGVSRNITLYSDGSTVSVVNNV